MPNSPRHLVPHRLVLLDLSGRNHDAVLVVGEGLQVRQILSPPVINLPELVQIDIPALAHPSREDLPVAAVVLLLQLRVRHPDDAHARAAARLDARDRVLEDEALLGLDGLLAGVERLRLDLSGLHRFAHGTTVATNAVIETILSRSAAKYYDPAATLNDDQIRELVRIGTTAPTSFHLQNWRFIAVRTPEAKARLRPIAWDQPAISDADVTFIIVGQQARYRTIPQHKRPVVEAGINYADLISEPAEEHFASAEKAGLTAISGLGATPGLTNVLAAKAANWLEPVS
jgi:alpha-D-ribose 1-methylphosphonate 5-triphosphate synthase subunit PhnH